MSALLEQLLAERDAVVHDYYDMLRETEKFRAKEQSAAIGIQKNFRMLRIQAKFRRIKAAVRDIKRVYKGYKSRLVYFALKQSSHRARQMSFFHEQAKTIQKYYRGYRFRQHFHDFYARKKYLQHVEKTNGEVRHAL